MSDHTPNRTPWRLLDTRFHGALDFAVAIVLMVAPFMFDFFADSGLAGWLSLGAGFSLFFYSLATDYGAGSRQALSIRQHLVLDGTAGAAFVVLAFVGGFTATTATFYGVVGFAVLAVVLVTKLPERAQPVEANHQPRVTVGH